MLDETTLAFAIDDKPKRPGRVLRRLRNLAENPRFALIVDRWDEDWGRLAFLLVEGHGGICTDPARHRDAIAALRARYPQYVEMQLDSGRHPVVELRIERLHRFGALA
jgi:PPOX class probable F420-dependent enzyme